MLRFASSLYFFDLPNDTHYSFLHLFGIIEIYKSLIASRFLLLIIQRVLGQSECSTIRVSFQFSFSERILALKFMQNIKLDFRFPSFSLKRISYFSVSYLPPCSSGKSMGRVSGPMQC